MNVAKHNGGETQVERNSPQCKLLNWKCDMQLTSSEIVFKLQVVLATRKMFLAFTPSAKVIRKCPKGPTLSVLLAGADIVCCITTETCLALFFMVVLPIQQLLWQQCNYTAVLLSRDHTIINLCHCSIHGYNCRGKKSLMDVAFLVLAFKNNFSNDTA